MLQEQLNFLWASKVLDYDFDMLSNKISFRLQTIDNKEENEYILVFNKVSIWYFINNISLSRKDIFEVEKGEYLEFTSIGFLKNAKIRLESFEKDWIKEYNGNGNICIEIWSKLLIIEASSVTLNEVEYPLECYETNVSEKIQEMNR